MIKKILYVFQIVILCASTTAYAAQSHYSIIIDAGSSGSRLHLYQYEQNQDLPQIKDILSKKVKPGLSSYADQPEQVGPSLKPLFDEALTRIQQQHIKPENVSLRILATAGMRLLPKHKQEQVYQAIQQYIVKHYPFNIAAIETVPEKMEGVYGWLDVNYLANNFDSNSHVTEGALDLGGASFEMTLAISQSINPENEINLTINGKNYIVFSKSFLGMGKDQTNAAMRNHTNAQFCYPDNYPLSENAIGSYQLVNCKNIYADIINEYHVAESHPNLYKQHFIAFSAFYFVSHFFESDHHTSQANFEQKIENVCSQSWQQLQQTYPDVPKDFLSTYCASGAYISDLLYDAYHLSGDQIIFTDKVKQQEIDWPLGALFYSLL